MYEPQRSWRESLEEYAGGNASVVAALRMFVPNDTSMVVEVADGVADRFARDVLATV